MLRFFPSVSQNHFLPELLQLLLFFIIYLQYTWYCITSFGALPWGKGILPLSVFLSQSRAGRAHTISSSTLACLWVPSYSRLLCAATLVRLQGCSFSDIVRK